MATICTMHLLKKRMIVIVVSLFGIVKASIMKYFLFLRSLVTYFPSPKGSFFN